MPKFLKSEKMLSQRTSKSEDVRIVEKKPMVVRTRKENQNVQLLTKSVKNVTELVTFKANAYLNLVDR